MNMKNVRINGFLSMACTRLYSFVLVSQLQGGFYYDRYS
jgi:hypothetical protein